MLEKSNQRENYRINITHPKKKKISYWITKCNPNRHCKYQESLSTHIQSDDLKKGGDSRRVLMKSG